MSRFIPQQSMLVNADFSLPAIVAGDQYQWIASPQRGVERVMLDRIGAEKARATSIVRYAAGSHFPGHHHPDGEEILVLAGVFEDDGGRYPAGWYLRNPPGSYHRPASAGGCTIFVKLRQMQAGDSRAVRIDAGDPARWSLKGSTQICQLFAGQTEEVWLHRIAPGHPILATAYAGIELLVLEGDLWFSKRQYTGGSWFRFPAGACPELVAGASGVLTYIKTGHLERLPDMDAV